MKLTNISNKEILIAPSLLAADFANLESEVKKVESGGAELLHLDVMDGHFVPNLTMGPPLIKSIRKHCNIIFDSHLMITNPLQYIESFVAAGSDHITFHLESSDNASDVIKEIKKHNITAGISIKPGTPVEKVIPLLEQIDLVLIMTVEPGFGGQKFMSDMMPKLNILRNEIDKLNKNIHIQVDGGIDSKTIATAHKNGANNFVAGTSVFRHPYGIESAIKELKESCSSSQ